MRRLPRALIASACALLLAAGTASAQGFRGVWARDAFDAIAVGDGGEVYRTLDGGNTWTERVLAPAVELRHVAARGFTIVIVGESGTIWKSTDSGGNWTLTSIPGAPFLRGLSMPSDSTWFAAGGSGVVLRTTNAGASWTTLVSGTGALLYGLCFTDPQHGWAAGDGGVLLVTANGGDTWTPVPLGTSHRLISVDQRATTVWVVGLDGTAYRSTDGGAHFDPVNLELDARSDVRVVSMRSPDTLWVAGGGGFIRYTTNGGATWTFQRHSMHAQISDLASAGAGVFACNNANRVVLASSDRGATWRLPTGASLTRTWGDTPKLLWSGTTRGSTFALNPVYKSTIYCVQGTSVFRSRDDGETWGFAASLPINYTKANAFLVSPRDSNLWLAAIGGGSVADRVFRTTNGGVSWDSVLTFDMGEYGIPLEMDPDHPDTVWFGGERGASGLPLSSLKRSTNFGATWSSIGAATFRSPCDLVVVPDTTGVLIVADGVTGTGKGRHLKSVDGGNTWTIIDSTSGSASEIPGLACSRLRPSQVVGTSWAFGGVQRSTDYGASWLTVDNAGNPWGIDICRDDPNVVVFGQYSANPPLAYISLDGGATYTAIPDPDPVSTWNSNYGIYTRDRATILSMQSSGIWKLQIDYSYTPASGAQSVAVVAPNGGESWTPGTVHAITWNAASVALARLEYRRAPGEPWQWIADVAGYLGSYSWTVPWDGTTQAKVRVYDAWDSAPQDSSNAVFTIPAPRLIETPAALDLGTHNAGSSTLLPLTLKNGGTGTLHVTSISIATGAYNVGRGSLTLTAGQQDTVGVWFQPDYGGGFPDTVTLVSDDFGHTPQRVPLAGLGIGPNVRLLAPNGGESWSSGGVHGVSWWDTLVTTVDLDYRVHPDSAWRTIAHGVPANPASYGWTIPGAATSQAAVRVRNAAGPPEDASDAAFSLLSALFSAAPDTVHTPPVGIGGTSGAALTLSNPGNLPLSVSSITVGNPEFWVGRKALVVPAGSSDTVGVFYSPLAVGADTTLVTIHTNEPGTPHQVAATGSGDGSLAVGARGGFDFALAQNQPNPFSQVTLIQYTLARDSDVSLEVFDLRGQRVATLARGLQPAGTYHVRFGASPRAAAPLAAGVYFYRLRAGRFAATRRMLLVP